MVENTATLDYTEDQLKAIDLALEGFKTNKELVTIGGYAGTGKTTIIREIIKQVDDCRVVTYTGKASSVLRSKGVRSQTIHSAIYDWDPESEEFYLVDHPECDKFIIDEVSMVGKELYEDLQSFGLPILAVGDPGQLEPVGDSTISLMDDPDIVLTEIHRQAKESAIIDLATRIREGEPLQYQNTPECQVRPTSDLESYLDWADVVLCGYNRTREAINTTRRDQLGYTDTLEIGDRIICTQNDRKLGVFNGMMMKVVKIKQRTRIWAECLMRLDDGRYCTLKVWLPGLADPSLANDWAVVRQIRGECIVADYAYSITVHKSQGSEWDKVSLVNQQAKWNQARWLYTGITRAAKELIVYT